MANVFTVHSWSWGQEEAEVGFLQIMRFRLVLTGNKTSAKDGVSAVKHEETLISNM